MNNLRRIFNPTKEEQEEDRQKYKKLHYYNSDNGRFYEKIIYEHPRDFIDDDWKCIE